MMQLTATPVTATNLGHLPVHGPLAALEASTNATRDHVREASGMFHAKDRDEVMLEWAVSRYDTPLHQALTMKERLALARDDLTRAPGDREVAAAARALEIRILQRDRKIDATTAAVLRLNAGAYTREREEPLIPLPTAIEFDQGGVLAAALERCPRIETMMPEERRRVSRDAPSNQ